MASGIKDENLLLLEAGLRVLSSLQPELALQRLLAHLSLQGLPLALVTLAFHDPRLGALRILVEASIDEGHRLERLTPLSPEARASLVALEPAPPSGRLEGPLHRDLEQATGHRQGCGMSLLLPVGGERALVSFFGPRPLGPAETGLLARLERPLALAVSHALEHGSLARERERLVDENRFLGAELAALSGDVLVGADGGLRRLMALLREVAPRDVPLCLAGEPGSGRSVAARVVHRLSPRQSGPMVLLRCQEISPSALEQELFGEGERRGRLERADRGTLFLDGIDALQTGLLRRLARLREHGKLERAGSSRALTVDVRLVLAVDDASRLPTELSGMAAIRVPPLRERPGDISSLVRRFLERRGAGGRELAPGALERLAAWSWPGNVAELRSVVERELLLRPTGLLSFAWLEPGGGPVNREPSLDVAMADHIRAVLDRCGGKVNGPKGAAEQLGIHPNTLRHRMRKLGISFGRHGSNPR